MNIERNTDVERAILLRQPAAPINRRRQTILEPIVHQHAIIQQPKQRPAAPIARRRNTENPRTTYQDYLLQLQQNRTAQIENPRTEQSAFISRGRLPSSQPNTTRASVVPVDHSLGIYIFFILN